MGLDDILSRKARKVGICLDGSTYVWFDAGGHEDAQVMTQATRETGAVCPRCGRESRPDTRFCQHCGREIHADNPYRSQVSRDQRFEASADGGVVRPYQHALRDGRVAGQQARQGSMSVAMTETTLGRVVVRSIAENASEDAQEFALDGRAVTVGRSPSCDIPLEGDQLASRRHALLRSEEDQYVIVDLGSSNGTYVNDTEIREPMPLHDGDHVVIGEHELYYYTSPAGPNASLAGVRLDEAPLSAPLTETNPHTSAVNAMDIEMPAPTQMSQPTPQAVDEPMAQTVASDSAASAFVTAPPMATRDELQAIQLQLAEASQAIQALAQRDVEGSRRAALAEVSAQLQALVSQGRQSTATVSGDAALLEVAQQAAADPRHLDNLMALSARAGDIAHVVAAQQDIAAQQTRLLDALDALRARLDSLA